MNGRSIRIFLVDGDANGLLTAEVMNGRTAWKLETDETYQAWHESRLPDEAVSDDD